MADPMTTLAITTDDGTSAVVSVPTRLLRAWERHGRALDAIMQEVLTYDPHASGYVDGTGNLCLMAGPGHTGTRGESHQEAILTSVRVHSLGGGDW